MEVFPREHGRHTGGHGLTPTVSHECFSPSNWGWGGGGGSRGSYYTSRRVRRDEGVVVKRSGCAFVRVCCVFLWRVADGLGDGVRGVGGE